MATTAAPTSVGKIVQVIGPVIDVEFEADTLPDLRELRAAGECRFAAPIQVVLEVAPLADVYTVAGRLQTTLELVCSRCLDPFQEELDSAFRLTLTQGKPEPSADDSAADRAVDPAEIGQIEFLGDAIDFRDVIQEQVLLALPMRALCHEDCQGLCASCGQPKRLGDCGCMPETGDPRLAVLKQLKLER